LDIGDWDLFGAWDLVIGILFQSLSLPMFQAGNDPKGVEKNGFGGVVKKDGAL
jgi:hypothetical protein